MLACCGLLVGESADPDCAGSSRLECIYASLGSRHPVIREVERPMAAAAHPVEAVGRADPLFVEIWTHRATQKNNSLHDRTLRKPATIADGPPDVAALEAVRVADDEREYKSAEPAAANLIEMLRSPRTEPPASTPSLKSAVKVKKIAVAPPTVEAPSAFADDVQSPKKKKKKKAKRKRVKPPVGEVAFSAAKQIPPRRNFSRQDAERLNNAAWTPDW
jgi:hypothetical protein